jgi:hypothetical protein
MCAAKQQRVVLARVPPVRFWDAVPLSFPLKIIVQADTASHKI